MTSYYNGGSLYARRLRDDGQTSAGDFKKDGESGAVYHGDTNVFEGQVRESGL